MDVILCYRCSERLSKLPKDTQLIRSKCISRSVVSDSLATPWTKAHQPPLSMGFPKTTEVVPFPLQGSSQPRDRTCVSYISCIGRSQWAKGPEQLILEPASSPVLCSHSLLCSTLCDPMDCSPPASSVHGISQDY